MSNWYDKMVEEEGPERERWYGFRQEVLSAFEPVLKPLGFSCVSADPYIVRFESNSMYIVLSHEPSSYEIDLEIGKLPDKESQRYSLFEIMEFLRIPQPRMRLATDREKVRDTVDWMARFIQDYCKDILTGDEDLLGEMDHFLLPERRRYNYRARHGEDPPEGWDPYSENWWI